ncbi:MAG TPA: WYL domain-containing protein [Tepidiformaceae bacterium]|nr:WYL domain-containing protein [Tepidiformaceae bacterium]
MTEQTRRSTRLLRIRDVLVKRGSVSCAELARELGYSVRTIQRDILALDTELNVPLVFEGRRWKIMPGTNMVFGPVRLTLQEARAVYFATRLMLRSADERDPDGISALEKIADALPDGVAGHMRRTVEEYTELPANMEAIEVLRKLTEAWAANRTATITYRSSGAASQPRTFDLDPYILDHSQSGTYVIGFSHEHGEVRTFKADRISDCEITAQEFEPESVDEIAGRLRHSWGGVVFGEAEHHVTIDFAASVANRIRESYWHPSQRLEELPGGGLRPRVLLPSLLEITPWIRTWGPEAIVVEPPELRAEIAASLAAAAANYNEGAAAR